MKKVLLLFRLVKFLGKYTFKKFGGGGKTEKSPKMRVKNCLNE